MLCDVFLSVYFYRNRTSGNTVVPDEFLFPDTELPNKMGNRPHFLYHAQRERRKVIGLPQRSSYMVEIKDFERDPAYEYKGDFPKHWWTIG